MVTGQTVQTALPWGTWRLQLTTTGNVAAQTVSLNSGIVAPVNVNVL